MPPHCYSQEPQNRQNETRERKEPSFSPLCSSPRVEGRDQCKEKEPGPPKIKGSSTKPAASASSRHGFDLAASVGWGLVGERGMGWKEWGSVWEGDQRLESIKCRAGCADLRGSCKKRAGREGGRERVVLVWRGPWLLRSGLLGAHVNLRCQSPVSPVPAMTEDCGSSRLAAGMPGCQCGAQ